MGCELFLGQIYLEGTKGTGISQDYAEAAKWLRKAAEQDNAKAQSSLGELYAKGNGVPQDYTEAAKWYRKAAEQGNPDAEIKLALAYEEGRGVPQDYVQALMWANVATAASKGDGQETDAKIRDSIAAKRTPKQIAE